jgi:phosphoglycerol transferase MdoB-like AlkP superfamily enzyme
LSWGNLDDLLVDNSVDYFVNGTVYNPNASVHKGADDMLVAEKELLPIFGKKNSFIVFQMDGSHYPYSEHAPIKIWKENGANSVESYDNSIYYTDMVLGKIIREFRRKNPDGWIFYSTDHGQALGMNGKFNNSFSLGVIWNLFFISAPNGYRSRLLENINKPVSQVDIVATILDIWDLKPVKPLDGVSLLDEVNESRIRVVSNYMPTLHNTPEAVLVFPDFRLWYLDFLKKHIILDTGEVVKFSDKNIEQYTKEQNCKQK